MICFTIDPNWSKLTWHVYCSKILRDSVDNWKTYTRDKTEIGDLKVTENDHYNWTQDFLQKSSLDKLDLNSKDRRTLNFICLCLPVQTVQPFTTQIDCDDF